MTLQMILKWKIICIVKSIVIVFDVLYPSNIFVSGACTDNHNSCAYWAGIGECARNHLWMLQNCPTSCKVCSGVPACTNIYNDQYCQQQLGNCWRASTAATLVQYCRKTCVCKCCSSTPVTTTTTTTANVISTTYPHTTVTTLYSTTTKGKRTTTEYDISTTSQTTSRTLYSATTEERRTTLISETTGNASIVSTTRRILNETEQDVDLDARRTSGSNTVLALAITAGVVVFIVVLVILLFWFRRRRRSSNESLNQVNKPMPPPAEKNCAPPEESIWLERQPRAPPRNPLEPIYVDTVKNNRLTDQVVTKDYTEMSSVETIPCLPGSPFYHVLEDPNMTETRGNPAKSAHSERSADRLPLDSDYEEPVLRGALPAIFPSSKARENKAKYETIKEHRNPSGIIGNVSNKTLENDDEHCYSYTTADHNFRREDYKKKSNEVPKTQEPFYHSLEDPDTGHQATSGYVDMTGSAEVSGYQPLQKSTRSFYQPLKKKK